MNDGYEMGEACRMVVAMDEPQAGNHLTIGALDRMRRVLHGFGVLDDYHMAPVSVSFTNAVRAAAASWLAGRATLDKYTKDRREKVNA